MTSTVPIRWHRREPPLRAGAVGASGHAAHRLLRRVLRYDDAQLAHLLGVASENAVVLRGAEAQPDPTILPWVDGVRYLGIDPAAPGLWIPTALTPSVPLPLLARAVQKHAASPIALLVDAARSGQDTPASDIDHARIPVAPSARGPKSVPGCAGPLRACSPRGLRPSFRAPRSRGETTLPAERDDQTRGLLTETRNGLRTAGTSHAGPSPGAALDRLPSLVSGGGLASSLCEFRVSIVSLARALPLERATIEAWLSRGAP